MFDWQDLFAAIGLFLVLEGMLPFISPDGYRRAAQRLSQLPDQIIRGTGIGLMVVGVVLLYLIH